MSRLLCCLRARPTMGGALSHPQEGEVCDGGGAPAAPPTMADVIRERKKKVGGAGLGTLRRRIAAAARRPRDSRPDRGCEHARFIRSVVSSWRLVDVFLLCGQLEAGSALRDLLTQAELAREPAHTLSAHLARAYTDRWWCDVELVGSGWSLAAHRSILAARCSYFRDLLQRYPPAPTCWRVPLEGAAAALSRDELEACVLALYAGPASRARGPLCARCAKWERGAVGEGELDIINVDNGGSCSRSSRCACGRGRVDSATLRRLAALLGFSVDALHHDMRYLLDSGEMADARLVFRLEGCGAAYGFRAALELPCHRVVLAARSRFFRSVMSRRGGGGAGAGGTGAGAVCVDEHVLPRRFARALLHAAYTDQVDLSLIGRHSSSPSSTNSSGSSSTAWGSRSAGGPTALDDAFQLYEIARFLEMPIVVQGCEDAIVEALAPDTLPHVLRWSAAPHASGWVHRQAMRYLRDEFPAIMSHAACGRVPRSALADALASPFLQASEAQALRALLRWAADQPADHREPNVVWHTAHSASRRGGRRRDLSDAALRDTLAALLPLLRVEHLPPDHDTLQQLVRRGVLAAPAPEGGSVEAWLGRGTYRAPRCFLPYLDEIKALLEDQVVPEAELARARHERFLQRIPDTLYMVAAARNGPPAVPPAEAGAVGASAAAACVSPRLLAALRGRARELRAAPPAQRALQLHSGDTLAVCRQIALRAVRELTLPDACAELLLPDLQSDRDRDSDGWEPTAGERERERARERDREPDAERWPDDHAALDCCRTLSGGSSARCGSAGSTRTAPHPPAEGSRAGTCRRDTARTHHAALHRSSAWGAALSAAVPDVAMAPNANTHLLTARDYFRPWDCPGGLQLDLGDGATHTPRPGSRAQRAAHGPRASRDLAQIPAATARGRADDELRAAIELSVIRAYSSFGGRAAAGSAGSATGAGSASAAGAGGAGSAATLPHRVERPPHLAPGALRSRSSASPPSAHPAPPAALSAGPRRAELRTPPPPHLALVRPSRSPSPAHSPSPRARSLYRHHDYRLEGYASSGSGSRAHSPNYA